MDKIITWLRLIKLPNIFTSISNVCAGLLIASNGQFLAPEIILVSFASALLYAGGIALNDFCDRKKDKTNRPLRPIPSGKISAKGAMASVVLLFILGVISGSLISAEAGVISVLVCLAIISYDSLFKKWFIGAVISMGVCRGLNWSLGLAAGYGLYGLNFIYPLVIFAYIAILTGIARFETKKTYIKKIVKLLLLAIPIIDGLLVIFNGYVYQGAIVASLVIPAFLLGKLFEMT